MKSLREILMQMFSKTNPGFPTVTGFDFTRQEPLIRSKAIRAKCLECQCGQIAEVSRCRMTDCPLWSWRFGRRETPADRQKWEQHALGSDSED